MTKSFGGRARQYQPRTRRRPPRAPAAVFPSVCLIESFDGGSWPIGPDLTWDEGHGARAFSYLNGFGTVLSGDGSDADQRTLTVVGGALTIHAPADSELVQGDLGWSRAFGLLRTATDLGTADMRVTQVVSAVNNPQTEYLLIARNYTDVDEDLALFFLSGWVAWFMDDYFFVEVYYDTGGCFDCGYAFFDNGSWTHTLAPGDELALTVTGSGATTAVLAEINGVTVLSLDSTTILAGLSFGDTLDMLPDGQRAGLGIYHLGGSSYATPTSVVETFAGNAFDLSWDAMMSPDAGTLTLNRYALGSAPGIGAIVNTVDADNVHGAGVIVDATTAGSQSVGERLTVLARVDGTDYTDWTGLGVSIACTNAFNSTYNVVIGFLQAGDSTGTLTSEVTGSFTYSAIVGAGGLSSGNFRLIVWDTPVDGSGVGDFVVSLLLAGGFLVPGFNKVTINGTATGNRWGAMLYAPSGTASVQIDTLTATRAGFTEVWDRANDDVARIGSWEACRA